MCNFSKTRSENNKWGHQLWNQNAVVERSISRTAPLDLEKIKNLSTWVRRVSSRSGWDRSALDKNQRREQFVRLRYSLCRRWSSTPVGWDNESASRKKELLTLPLFSVDIAVISEMLLVSGSALLLHHHTPKNCVPFAYFVLAWVFQLHSAFKLKIKCV